MAKEHPALLKTPRTWIEEIDIEKTVYGKATWIPLLMQRETLIRGKNGTPGYRREHHDVETLIVPLSSRERHKNSGWQSIVRNAQDAAWIDEGVFHPPGHHCDDDSVRYTVLRQWFDTGEPNQWHLFQELELSLKLLRTGDIWIRPEENDVEVARIERDRIGKPQALLFRAEHLRDYLCARGAALLLTSFVKRDADEDVFPDLREWENEAQTRTFPTGLWEGRHFAIHEGGMPYGQQTHVLHAWRESVNPEDDIPVMPHPSADTHGMNEYVKSESGRKLFALEGRIWTKEWIEPASQSPRVRWDHVESRVPFLVENQESKTLSGDVLAEYRGWLWFRPTVMRRILTGKKSVLKWSSKDTGEVGPANNKLLQFGVNSLGLINVLAYKMAALPEWVQRLWVPENIGPEGGLSEELHVAQNLARYPGTIAPESMLWRNLCILQAGSNAAYGQSLLRHLPTERDFFAQIHRFYDASFEQLCELCKELHRIIAESIDISLCNSTIDPGNAERANRENLRQIKRVALWLDASGKDGRKITAALAGVADLRQGNAHSPSSTLRSSLAILEIPADATEYQRMCAFIIQQVALSVGLIAETVISSHSFDEGSKG